jgi:hypothetical protein
MPLSGDICDVECLLVGAGECKTEVCLCSLCAHFDLTPRVGAAQPPVVHMQQNVGSKRKLGEGEEPSTEELFNWQLPPPEQKWSLTDHKAAAYQIEKHFLAIEFYINQVHSKKAVFKRTKFTLNSDADEKFYSQHLFHGRGYRSGGDCYPLMFSSRLEETAFRENPDEVSLANVYYFGHKENAEESVKNHLLPLSNEKTLTDTDRLLVHNANAAYVEFMDTCIEKIGHALPKDSQLPVMKRHRKRIAKLTL